MAIRCIVIDDDDIFRKVLVKAIQKLDALNLVQEFDNPLDAINFLSKEKVELIFSDVEMPEMSGLDFISSLSYKPKIILITAHENYAVKAFDYEVTDYLVKPFQYPRFLKAIDRVKAELESEKEQASNPSDSQYLFVKKKDAMIKVDFRDILWIEADTDYMVIQTESESFMMLSTMKALESKLSAEFMRVHRSFIVRLDKINAIQDSTIIINRKVIPISDSYWPLLKARLKMT
ncbi:MAG: LytTR family DNA-binding domain-containing protein [Chloroherpetonaceae bacterium]|nr:LytTR family DNA-binding domain-containing protein [Chloroherpetonaceae bacterium]